MAKRTDGAPRGLKLGILETGRTTLREAIAPKAAVQETTAGLLELASLADRLGYHRLWLPEDHGDGSLQASPEILLPALGARTRRIRLGIGGVLLSCHPALRVAEGAHLLEAMFPGRIDLGLSEGAAPLDPRTFRLLVDDPDGAQTPERYERKLDEVVAFLRGGYPYGHPLSNARAYPTVPTRPEIWQVGGGASGMALAARHRIGFLHVLPERRGGDIAAEAGSVRRHDVDPFPRTAGGAGPRLALAARVLCAETERDALRLDEAARKSGAEGHAIVGSPARCRERLDALREASGASEVLVTTEGVETDARVRSFTLLAEACGLHSEVART